MVAGCCGGKLVDGDRLVLVDVGVEEVPGEIGDIDAEIGGNNSHIFISFRSLQATPALRHEWDQ